MVEMLNSQDGRVVDFPVRTSRHAKSPDMTDRHVGARIRLQRTLVGMTQEKLADILGITFQQVQKYEKGTNRVGAGRLLAISKALGVSVSFFFEGQPTEDSESKPSDVQSLLASREGIALAQAFVRIESDSMRQAIVSLAQAAARDR
jgi:transcriptional regulator with XRE-family HTH domain